MKHFSDSEEIGGKKPEETRYIESCNSNMKEMESNANLDQDRNNHSQDNSIAEIPN